MAKRVALYVRVSTNGQETANQQRELELVAARHGWEVVARFADQGISGTKGREQRPGLKGLYEAVSRKQVDLVMAWSVDRLGRSLKGLVDLFEELKAKGIGLYLHQQNIDTTTPAGEALLGMSSVFAAFERAIIVERVKSGLARTKANGVTLGRKTLDRTSPEKVRQIEAALLSAGGLNTKKIGRALGVGTGTVQRVKARLNAEGRLGKV